MRAPLRDVWLPRLDSLCERIRDAARSSLAGSDPCQPMRAVRQGAGDVTYALDDSTERAALEWQLEIARTEPLSVLTEDSGWRHFGPARSGAKAVELAGFDHGGPRIALDPVDGTRNLMADLRSAWTVVSFAGPGAGEPRLSEVELGVVAEIPDSRAARRRVLWAERGGPCHFELRGLDPHAAGEERVLAPNEDDRADHGYFPFFRYAPEERPAIAALEAAFFERLERLEGAELRHCFDDQYISNAGQLVLLALGTYRMIADLRGLLARRRGRKTITSKPYDIAGAVVCAQAAGCIVTAPDGGPLDFPLDCTTPVDFVGWTNAATARRLAPHLAAVLA